jgi:hypothetical protein
MTITDEEKPTHRKFLLCAYGIAEYTTALDHLAALRQVQVPVPQGTVNRLESERRNLARLWWHANHGDPTWEDDRMEQVVTEARAWVTDHLPELEQLIDSTRRNQENE